MSSAQKSTSISSVSGGAKQKQNLLQKTSAECVRCANSYTKEQWGKVFLCYFLFYAILSTWMVIHISVMVSLLPSRDSFCNSETNYNNLQFCMGEPNYHSWLTKHITYANAESVSEGIPMKNPWSKNGEVLDKVSDFSDRNYAFQQVRILNQWDLHTMIHPGYGQRVTCKPSNTADAGKVIFYGFQNPFTTVPKPATGFPDSAAAFATTNTWASSEGNIFLNTTVSDGGLSVAFTDEESFDSNGITIYRGLDFTVEWTSPAQAPHIIQFMMTGNANPLCAADTGVTYPITCSRAGLPDGYTGEKCTNCDYGGPEEGFSVVFNNAATMSSSTC